MLTLKTQKTFWLILSVVVSFSCYGFGKEKTAHNFNDIETYNVVWNSPGKDSSGSMPIGNGGIGLNLWVEENGDLLFYISKTDSWSDNCRLLKLGRVRLKLSPNPFGKEEHFSQTLENNRIVWYHRNEKSCYPVTLKNQHLDRLLEKYRDPLLYRTFGGCMKGDGLKAVDKDILKSAEPGNRFVISIYPLTAQKKPIDTWLDLLEKQIAAIDTIDLKVARAAHRQWWESFWKRSWIFIDGSKDAEVVTRGYNLQRWINACGGRGAYPIKFNGSIFTVDARVGKEHLDGDYRRWGGMYWWQNTRLPYWSMLAAGDFDLMQPLFKMYINALGLCRDKTRIYYKHDGAFFPETMHFWGTNGNCDFGWGHKGPETINRYIRREWQGGIELIAMMLDYYAITQDRKFLRNILLPLADEIITFFDRHWPRDEQGKIRFEPAQSLETWWQCVNPLPEVAGLRFVLSALLELPDELTNASRRIWGPNYDWIPDQDHGCVTMTALQRMLMQTDGRKIYLLPAWPGNWDVDFKLHAPFKTVIQGTVRKGRIKKLHVTPENRRKDIKLLSGKKPGYR